MKTSDFKLIVEDFSVLWASWDDMVDREVFLAYIAY